MRKSELRCGVLRSYARGHGGWYASRLAAGGWWSLRWRLSYQRCPVLGVVLPLWVGVLWLTLGCVTVRSSKGACGVASGVVPWSGRVTFRLARTGP
jgi:hypothetical protein